MIVTEATPRPWLGTAYRHIPSGGNRDVLDFRHAGRQPDNRWNASGEPTLYLAGDPGILIAEWGRHFPVVFDDALQPVTVERTVFRLSLRLQRVVDLRSHAAVKHAVTSPWFLDRDVTRAVARSVRAAGTAQALIVPSIAFLDDLTRWNLVVFI
ncbi:MAG: RES family NAD+ phosphorylase, partial [Chloroflexota bacterium]|nr:RES family NAD+ phosphorylase [Chloroflexota bacterium]